MAKGFDRLRLVATVGAVGLLAGIGGASRSARAATFANGGSVTAAGARWGELNNSSTGPGTFGSGFAMTDGGLVSPSRSDAFDGALMCRVNGTTYRNPSGSYDASAVAGGTRITPAVQTIGGLQVQLTYYASGSRPVLRGICTVTNPTGAPIAITLLMGSNLGSDGSTTIRSSSSGDAAVGATDRWFVSSDTNPATGDPVLLMGRFGLNASALPTLVQTPGAGNDDFVDQYTTTVAPGQTVSFMQLAWLNTDIAPANANAPSFDSTTTLAAAGLLADLSAPEIARIVNYGAGAAAVVAQVPTLSESGGMALAILVGASGLAFLVRRRRPGEV